MSINWKVEQRSPEWLEKRLGIPTASQFHRIITKTGALSEQRHDYINELLSERFLGRPMEGARVTEWMQRGIDLEDEAVHHFINNQRSLYGRTMKVEKVGFITTNDGKVGCSPDRIVCNEGSNLSREAVEIKCPAPWTHLGYIRNGLGDEYLPQVQGQMLIGEFDLVHFYSYHPEFPPNLQHFYHITERRPGYIDKLATRLHTFMAELEQAYEELKGRKS